MDGYEESTMEGLGGVWVLNIMLPSLLSFPGGGTGNWKLEKSEAGWLSSFFFYIIKIWWCGLILSEYVYILVKAAAL